MKDIGAIYWSPPSPFESKNKLNVGVTGHHWELNTYRARNILWRTWKVFPTGGGAFLDGVPWLHTLTPRWHPCIWYLVLIPFLNVLCVFTIMKNNEFIPLFSFRSKIWCNDLYFLYRISICSFILVLVCNTAVITGVCAKLYTLWNCIRKRAIKGSR